VTKSLTPKPGIINLDFHYNIDSIIKAYKKTPISFIHVNFTYLLYFVIINYTCTNKKVTFLRTRPMFKRLSLRLGMSTTSLMSFVPFFVTTIIMSLSFGFIRVSFFNQIFTFTKW